MYGKLSNSINGPMILKKAEDCAKYPERVVCLPICQCEEKYLILRIDKHWKFCPGDWDFVIATFIDQDKSPAINAILNVKAHTGLNGRILKEYPVLRWYDHESRILFVLFPFLIKVGKENLQLSKKFFEVKWVWRNSIVEYDRNEYLLNVVSHISNHGGL